MGVVIAIDGPAGSGKSTTAKLVALKLGCLYIDTGAMYRAVTLEAIRCGVDISNGEIVVKIANDSNIKFEIIDNCLRTFLNGEDVTDDIRTSVVANNVSQVSAIEGVREVLVRRQRQIAEYENVVMEGRDIGTIVFPAADFKFYLDADIKVRTHRRMKDYQKMGQKQSFREIKEELHNRDRIDSTREFSPLKRAEGAIVVDTTNLSIEEQVEIIVNYVRKEGDI